MGTTVLGESLASRRVGMMTDDDDGVTSASGFNGSLSLCLAPHYLSVLFFFFSFLSSSFTFSIMFIAEYFFFFLIYMGHGLSEFFFFFFLIYMGHGLFKTPGLAGWLAGIGMVEVRGVELKTKGPKLFFGKFYIIKKKKFGPGRARAPFALHLGPSLVGDCGCGRWWQWQLL